jgi:hypothetical protein
MRLTGAAKEPILVHIANGCHHQPTLLLPCHPMDISDMPYADRSVDPAHGKPSSIHPLAQKELDICGIKQSPDMYHGHLTPLALHPSSVPVSSSYNLVYTHSFKVTKRTQSQHEAHGVLKILILLKMLLAATAHLDPLPANVYLLGQPVSTCHRADQLTQSTASQSVKRLTQGHNWHAPCSLRATSRNTNYKVAPRSLPRVHRHHQLKLHTTH